MRSTCAGYWLCQYAGAFYFLLIDAKRAGLRTLALAILVTFVTLFKLFLNSAITAIDIALAIRLTTAIAADIVVGTIVAFLTFHSIDHSIAAARRYIAAADAAMTVTAVVIFSTIVTDFTD